MLLAKETQMRRILLQGAAFCIGLGPPITTRVMHRYRWPLAGFAVKRQMPLDLQIDMTKRSDYAIIHTNFFDDMER